MTEATRVLAAHSAGDCAASAVLLPLVYDKLRALARNYLKREGGYQTLQPTALVHEAYLRLIDVDRIDWAGKTHFFAMAATQMRRILVERARAAAAQKRGRRPKRLTLDDGLPAGGSATVELLILDETLDRLTGRSARQARVAEMRVFSGMLFREIALAVGVTERTVRQDWRMARAWLSREMGRP